MSRSWSLDHGLVVLDQSSVAGAWFVVPIWTLFLPVSSWLAREIFILPLVSTFQYFILCILLLCLLVIIYSSDIISCIVITVYWCYYCWIVYYHYASVLWFLPVLMLSVYTLGYFRPSYIRRSNVSVPSGSGRYRVVSELLPWSVWTIYSANLAEIGYSLMFHVQLGCHSEVSIQNSLWLFYILGYAFQRL